MNKKPTERRKMMQQWADYLGKLNSRVLHGHAPISPAVLRDAAT